MEYTLKDILNIPKLRELLDSLDEIHSMPSAIIDIDGVILTATAWQDICTEFHRINPETKKKCIESDTHIGAELDKEMPHVVYHCPMGLVDAAAPIILEGKHLGNVFTGQVFIVPPDETYFIKQAHQFDFDEAEYLAAMRKVPYYTEEQLHKNLTFIHRLTLMLAERGLQALRLQETSGALQKKEKDYRQLFQNQPSGFAMHEIILDAEGKPYDYRFLEINPAFENLTGLKAADLIGKTQREVMPESEPYGVEMYGQVALTGKPISFENLSVTLNKHFQINAYSPEPRKFATIYSDITERKQAEKILKESEEKFSKAFNISPSLITIASMDDGRYVDVNNALLATTGYQRDEVIGHTSSELGFWLDVGDRQRYIEELANKGTLKNYDVQFRMKNGDIRDFLISSEIIEIEKKRCSLNHILDITERKKNETALSRSEFFFKESQRSASIGSYQADFIAGTWVSSEVLDEIFGIDDDYNRSIQGWLNIVHPDDRDLMDRYLIEEVISNRKPFSKEYRIVRQNDGEIRWVNGRGSADFDSDGNMLSLTGTIQDITEQKLAGNDLKHSHELMRYIIHNNQSALAVHDKDLRYLYVSQRYLDDYKVKDSDIIGKHHYEVFPDLPQKWRDVHKKALEGVILSSEEDSYEREDGTVEWTRWECRPWYEANGEIGGIILYTDVITERKRAEENKSMLQNQLQQAQKMESIGRLAGGVAHDFNNMLSVILGHAELGLMHIDPGHRVCADLKEISKAAERSADLTRQLLAFARKQTIAPKVIDLNETVTGMFKMLQRLIGEDINLTWKPSACLWPVMMDASQLDQILANLCVNARDAIPDVGMITIETENCTIDNKFSISHVEVLPGEYVKLSVSDNGSGIDKEVLANIFEPFFTTKELGKGTGLGLATVYGAVKQNNGYIDVYSEPEIGTTFTIYLPHYKGKSAQVIKEGGTELHLKGYETILLVEDEPSILEMVSLILEQQGYKVLAANTPSEAMQLAREHAGEIHLLMTDVVMPEMNGKDLAKNLLSIYPGMKRLFMSGYTADVIAHHGVLDEGMHFIQKPFNINALAGKLREVLDS